jgi:hypothetical protein
MPPASKKVIPATAKWRDAALGLRRKVTERVAVPE